MNICQAVFVDLIKHQAAGADGLTELHIISASTHET